MNVHEKIKEKRLEKGLTQKEVADYLFVSNKTYSQYERGLRNVELETFLKLAEFLDITMEELNYSVSINYAYKQVLNWYEKIGMKMLGNDMLEKNVTFLFTNKHIQIEKKKCKELFPILRNVSNFLYNLSEKNGEVIFETFKTGNLYEIIIKNNSHSKTVDDWISEQLESKEMDIEEVQKQPDKEILLNQQIQKDVVYVREHFIKNYMKNFEENGGKVYGKIDDNGKIRIHITFM